MEVLGRAEQQYSSSDEQEDGIMSRQRKRLEHYLERNGLEIRSEPGRAGVILSEALGDLRAPDLMDRVLERENFDTAVQQVVRNGGAGGVDGMSASELPSYVEQNWDALYLDLRTGHYKPKPVRRATIPKPDGGERNLGVPTVLDRAVQQAVAQVLSPLYEPKFSDRSFGFRPGRSAQDAITRIKEDCDQGCTWAVDIDLSKYFDTINHDLLMEILRRDIKDETLLILIKRFLKSGVMVDGLVHATEEGSPQGGNLSPLLANIYLNEFDWTMENRGHRFVRYADDIIVLMPTKKGATRVMETCRKYLEGTLKLRLNEDKSQVAQVHGIKYLGFTLELRKRTGIPMNVIGIHPKSFKRFENKIREILRKNSPVPVESRLTYLKQYVRGWLNYYGLAEMKCAMESISKWTRRKLRALLLKQWKRTYRRGKNLQKIQAEHGIVPIRYKSLWRTVKYDGIWNMSNDPTVTHILHNRYLEEIGCPNILSQYVEIHFKLLNRRDTRVRPVV